MPILFALGEAACAIVSGLATPLTHVVMVVPTAIVAVLDGAIQLVLWIPQAVWGGIVTVVGGMLSVLMFWN